MRKAINYETTPLSVYRFACLSNPLLEIKFVGFTANLIKIKQTHKTRANNPLNNFNKHLYDSLNENGGIQNFRLIELEKRTFKDKQDAERYCYELLKTL